ncbi:MAG: heavy metal-binding domain-containing protein [Gallionellaceae bacterium]|nr:heavy metal-binding domain-containing protein [Gallionellaceae bacterium]
MEGLFSLLLFAGLFFLMMRFGCGSHIGHGGCGHHHSEHSRHDGHGATAGSIFHVCPMHPEIRQTYPGNCPKCGMALEPESNKEGE